MHNQLREQLSGNLHIFNIHEIYASLQGNIALLEELCLLINDDDRRVCTNALWLMTHFSKEDNQWLTSKQDYLIDTVLATGDDDTSKRRMLLVILAKQPFEEERIRTDFLDYCLEHITMTQEATASRCRCMELAFAHCRFYPELLHELEMILDMVAQEPMLPAVSCTRKKVLRQIHHK